MRQKEKEIRLGSTLNTQKTIEQLIKEDLDNLKLQQLYRSLDFLKENAKGIENSLYRKDLNLFGVKLRQIKEVKVYWQG